MVLISSIWAAAGLLYLVWTDKAYRSQGKLSIATSTAGWIIYFLHFIIVIISVIKGLWKITLPLPQLGWILIVAGSTFYLWALLSIKSLSRMSGLKTDRLITTGAFAYSRNPQNMSWFLVLIGISLVGQSVFALLMTMVLVVGFRLDLIIEERHLERIYTEKWKKYAKDVPRWLKLLR